MRRLYSAVVEEEPFTQLADALEDVINSDEISDAVFDETESHMDLI